MISFKMMIVRNIIYRLYTKGTFNQSIVLTKQIKHNYFTNLSQFKLCLPSSPIRYLSSSKTLLSKCNRNHIFGWNCNSNQLLFIRSRILQSFKNLSINPLSNIKVINNVMLYRYERPWFYKLAAVFGIFTFIGCLTMANNVYIVLCRKLFEDNQDLKTRLLEHIFPLSMIGLSIFGGPAILYLIWYVTIRSVKYLILRKGSKAATIVTYHPVKGERIVTVPINEISCISSRAEKKAYVQIKLKNNKTKYIIEKSGQFVNPELFDATIGTHRF